MNKIVFALLSLLPLAAGPAFAQGADPVTDLFGGCGRFKYISTYGDDNREEYCSANITIRNLADSVAGLFTDGSSVTLTGKSYVYGTTTLGETRDRVAPDQRFVNQPAAAFCTGFLVGDDLLVTAGHCVKDHLPSGTAPKDHKGACQENPEFRRQGDFCENIRVVFGFRKDLGGVIPPSAPARDVYKCAKVISHSLVSGPDYAVFKLDRKVSGRWPLAINRGNRGLSAETPLFVIGHPSGLPLKIAGDAEVVAVDTDVYVNDNWGGKTKWADQGYSFLTNLDTFHGNSGSPVFNLYTLMVEGILVSGDNDYVPHADYPGQSRAANFPQQPVSDLGKGVGEVCTKISVPASRIPATGVEKAALKMNAKYKNKLYPAILKHLIEQYRKQRNYIQPEHERRQSQAPQYI
ncbi:MAG TPA: hypothetical protein DCZ92_11480 [Elusimicrobia bacterium]|nr:MAG: hypothetical protein A2016_05715 [Elusimicrobia bacterium GWF2_62_30]HBA61414.1 hypothetical protein [Elusimicrobiota bacterium]